MMHRFEPYHIMMPDAQHRAWLNAVHPWLNAIRHQYVAQYSASRINMAVHYMQLCINMAQCSASCIKMAQFGSVICIVHLYGSVLCIMHQNCGSILCTPWLNAVPPWLIHWCASDISSIYSSILCIRHQCGCALYFNIVRCYASKATSGISMV